MDVRYDKITKAHRKTLEWIFRPPTSDTKWADFLQWIQSDDPLYWIAGKAGAGKSTLMRFINDHERTQQALQNWAAGGSLITACFFFWNSGTNIQMSHEGLVRTVLYKVLQQMPELLSHVFPRRVEMGIMFSDYDLEEQPWTWEELLKGFQILVEKATETTKIMFFIDGMDECEGKSSDLIELITSLISPKVKFCVSSRPWIAYEDAFKSYPHLRLEDLTFEDIKHYVTSKLNASPGYQVYKQLDQAFTSQLVDNLCTKSSGVFLWVFLVTQSLLEGISEGDSLSDLQTTLNSLPADVEDLFRKILDTLDSKHLSRASQLFQIIRASILPMDLLHLSFADEDDPETAIKLACTAMSFQEANSRAERMRRRINACCKGLLETSSAERTNMSTWIVNYLHRTVRDFLERDDVWTKLCGITTEELNPNARLCNSQIMRLKTQNPDDLTAELILDIAAYGIEYALRADPKCSTCQGALLHAIDRAATEITAYRAGLGAAAPYWGNARRESQPAVNFLEFAVRCGLERYVETTLRTMPHATRASCISLLLYSAVSPYQSLAMMRHSLPTLQHGQAPSRQLIKILLDHGADPNHVPANSSAWSQVIARYSVREGIVEEFLLHGADPRHPRLNDSTSAFNETIKRLINKKKGETRWSYYGLSFRKQT